MDIKLIKTNTNKKLLQNLFDNMSKKLTKEEIQQYIFAGNLNHLIYLVKEYNNPVYRKEVVLSYLINLIAQVSLEQVASLLDQAVASSCIGLYGLQIKSRVASVASKCFISYCTIENLMLRYKNFEHIRTYVEIKHSDINVLRVVLETPTTPIQNYDKTILKQLRKWLESYNTKVNEIQISYK